VISIKFVNRGPNRSPIKVFIACPIKNEYCCIAIEPRWLWLDTLRAVKSGDGVCRACAAFSGGHVSRRSGYRTIRVNGEYILEHRLIKEKHIGRKLTRTEEVHHRNLKRADNRISNLQLKLKSNHGRGISPADMKHSLETTFSGVRVFVPKKWIQDFKP
jgi:hypothetical protein